MTLLAHAANFTATLENNSPRPHQHGRGSRSLVGQPTVPVSGSGLARETGVAAGRLLVPQIIAPRLTNSGMRGLGTLNKILTNWLFSRTHASVFTCTYHLYDLHTALSIPNSVLIQTSILLLSNYA